ncbi:hypothetical protein SGLAD_v1c06280 [Spiroplasma gladiatoris]|uniref:Lipoprotein n=1 Tax=Spiroplasma gladiatoris TaxID=2143 RepID=A0A4P7AHW0_9MOLU|nr:lipoprotein [Spiroplasma gladiatoris]QBQ07827.1 hypothetical protein SGLAD_v1c06280 [Spiroplasma gladiatoris]
MKKILTLLASTSLMTSVSSVVISCNQESSSGPGKETEVNSKNIKEKVELYKEKYKKFNDYLKKINDKEASDSDVVSYIKLGVDLYVMDYEICKIDENLLPDYDSFRAIKTANDLVKRLKEMKEYIKEYFSSSVYDLVEKYMDSAIKKYSK